MELNDLSYIKIKGQEKRTRGCPLRLDNTT